MLQGFGSEALERIILLQKLGQLSGLLQVTTFQSQIEFGFVILGESESDLNVP